MTDDLEKTPNPLEEALRRRPERLGDRQSLRPERLGQREELRPERLGSPLSAAEVEDRLGRLPGWELAQKGTALARTFGFPTLRAAVAFIALVAEVGEADGYVPEIDLRLLEVTVRVDTHVGEPLTDLDFQIARGVLPR